MHNKIDEKSKLKYLELNESIANMNSIEIIEWGYKEFGKQLAFTTSFGIQSAVLLDLIYSSSVKNQVKIFWIDTGYLPSETYQYANTLIDKLSLSIEVIQSEFSPARMEALYGKLWESKKIEDLDKYHQIRKVQPLEIALEKYSIHCWGSGVRAQQTDNRKQMKFIDLLRGRLSLRPLLGWSKKDIYYYMEEKNLPQHPLFMQGYSTVGDWHSSSPDNKTTQGRGTRFGGVKQECGLHTDS